MKSLVPLLALAAVLALPAGAQAACPERVGVAFGDTLASIAQACGVNVEALRQLNPGLTAKTLRQGTFVRVPQPPLPSTWAERRRGTVEVIPPLVRSPSVGATPTVILPPQPDRGRIKSYRPDELFTPRFGGQRIGTKGFGVQPYTLQRN